MTTKLYQFTVEGRPVGQYRQMSEQEAKALNLALVLAGGEWQLWRSEESLQVEKQFRQMLEELRGQR